MTEPTTHTIEVPGAVLAYDVREPAAPAGLRPLFVFGSPMGASGFSQLVDHLDDRPAPIPPGSGFRPGTTATATTPC